MRYILIIIVMVSLLWCTNKEQKKDVLVVPEVKKTIKKEPHRDIQYITIHHTDGVMEEGYKAIKKFNWRHKDILHSKLSCAGYYVSYHYVIGVNWDVVKTRCEYEVGNHDPNHNSHSIGIALVGTFYQYEPTDAQYQALNQLIKDIKTRYDGISVLAHRDESEKDPCPWPMFDRNKVRDIKILSIK